MSLSEGAPRPFGSVGRSSLCVSGSLCAAGVPVGAHGGTCIPQGFGLTEAPSGYYHSMF